MAPESMDPLVRQESVYALTPDKRWLHPTWAFPFLAIAWCSHFATCFLLNPTFAQLRLFYTVVSVVLLLYRVRYYAHKEWLLFFIDLCYVGSVALLWSLWFCDNGACSKEWLFAVYIVVQGPVAGATFPLQTPLTLHHPEAFESFFLHAGPMWISYAVRWRWVHFDYIPHVGELVWSGFRLIYLPWVVAYLAFLLAQPFLPDVIAGAETLPDGFIFPSATRDQRLQGKSGDNYPSYAFKACAAVTLHAVLSCSGFLAAALAYQNHTVQLVWIFCVLTGAIFAGARFYYKSLHPEYVPPGVLYGFVRMGLAWAVVGPTYIICVMYAT